MLSKTPGLPYAAIVKALQRDGWIIVRQRGMSYSPEKHLPDEALKITVPAHRPAETFDSLAHIEAGKN